MWSYGSRAVQDLVYACLFSPADPTVSRPSSPRGYEYHLFVPPRDRHELLWSGERTGVEGAVEHFAADEVGTFESCPVQLVTNLQAFPNTRLAELLPGYLSKAKHTYASLPPSPSPSASSQPFTPPPPRRRSSLLKLFSPPESTEPVFQRGDPPHLMLAAALASEHTKPLERAVQALRVRKSPAEIELMARAAQISGRAHADVMRFSQPGRTEGQLAAFFEYQCAMRGSERPAYVPVVASG